MSSIIFETDLESWREIAYCIRSISPNAEIKYGMKVYLDGDAAFPYALQVMNYKKEDDADEFFAAMEKFLMKLGYDEYLKIIETQDEEMLYVRHPEENKEKCFGKVTYGKGEENFLGIVIDHENTGTLGHVQFLLLNAYRQKYPWLNEIADGSFEFRIRNKKISGEQMPKIL